MMSFPLSRLLTLAAVAGVCAGTLGLSAAPAEARVFVGVGIGVPYYAPYPYYGAPYYPYAAPYYAPPPVYYAPPQTYAPPQSYVPPQASTPAAASGGPQACYAEHYVCPMDRPAATGSSCYCPGNNGQRVWGRAN